MLPPGRALRCLVHGDDFVTVGDSEDLEWMKERLQNRFEIKTTIVGPREDGEVNKKKTDPQKHRELA